MIPVLADTSTAVAPYLIGFIGSGGLIGAIVGFLRIRPEKETAAMSQAQGANEVLQSTLEEVVRDRDYWKRLYRDCARERTHHHQRTEGS